MPNFVWRACILSSEVWPGTVEAGGCVTALDACVLEAEAAGVWFGAGTVAGIAADTGAAAAFAGVSGATAGAGLATFAISQTSITGR